MVYLKWGWRIVFWTAVLAFLHYTLPQHDIVRITDTYEKRVNPGENTLFWSNANTGENVSATERDVFFIQTFLTDDDPMIYRNEDTGWGWPPYFKFDTANLQAEAADLKSTGETPKWVSIKHYGWRNEFMSIYPNAVEVRAVAGPDVGTGIPWFNILIIGCFLVVVLGVWALWRRFRARRIDPVFDDIGESWDAAGDRVDHHRSRFKRWRDSWKPKHKR